MVGLHCDMHDECDGFVCMIDDKGFVYCETHGVLRRDGYRRCRKLRPHERNRLERGMTIARY